MADGTFDTSGIGDSIKQGLMLRYRAQQQAIEDAHQTALAGMRARSELLGRLTLSGPGGAPVPAESYLSAAAGAPLSSDVMGQPTPAFVGAARDTTQAGIAGARATTDQLKAATAQHTKLVENLKNYDTSAWKQNDYATYFGTGQLPTGAKPIPKPSGKGAGKTKYEQDIANLKAQEKTALDDFNTASKMTGSSVPFTAAHNALKTKQQVLLDIRQRLAALEQSGGAGAGAAKPAAQFDDLYKKHGLL